MAQLTSSALTVAAKALGEIRARYES